MQQGKTFWQGISQRNLKPKPRTRSKWTLEEEGTATNIATTRKGRKASEEEGTSTTIVTTRERET
jgi:hypothetical protein